MQATRERSQALHVAEYAATAFDPTAVPQAYTFPATVERLSWEQFESEDLVSLGEEQLFTGDRKQSRAAEQTRDGALQVPSPIVSDELLGSLTAARHAFLFALSSLIQHHVEDEREGAAAGPSSQPWSNINPFATPILQSKESASAADSADDTALEALVDSLRRLTEHPASLDSPMVSTNSSSPLVGITPTCRQRLMDELQARVDALSVELSAADAHLARSLGSLLTCIERLLSISRPPLETTPRQGSTITPAEPVSVHGSPNVYLTLEREARALQENRKEQWDREQAEQVVGAAREVEQAERDLLWGRVDDLSETVRKLCRQRAETLARDEEVGAEEAEEGDEQEVLQSSRKVSFDADSVLSLPRYSHDGAAQSNGPHHPPAYFTDYISDDKSSHLHEEILHSPSDTQSLFAPSINSVSSPLLGDHPAAPSRSRIRTRRISGVHTEKMQRELDSVSSAIERLYVVAPQLANQRVEPDRRQLRERQLAKLGNAIERLSKGRLNDQRAAPSPLVEEDDQEREARIRRGKDQALDKLIDQIDRAASRTLTDQRVDLNKSKRRELLNASTLNEDFEPLSDAREAQRREFILEHTGKGRLASQDATLPRSAHLTGAFPGPPPLEDPVSLSEFFADEGNPDDEPYRQRSNSLTNGPIKKKFSTLQLGLFTKGSSPMGSRRGSYDSRIPAEPEKSTQSPSMSRRGTADSRLADKTSGLGLAVFGSGMSRSASTGLEVLSVPAVDFVAEESRNLGTLVVTFWSRVASSSKEEWRVVSVEAEALLIAPASGGSASRLALPCRVVPQQVSITSTGNTHEAKLITLDPSPTRSRHDLEVHAPLSTAELRDALPSSFACAKCHTTLVDASLVTKYNALPSEHWAELLDAWMCHQDQALSDDLIAKGKGIKPREGEGLVGSSYIVFESRITRNWTTPASSEPARAATDDLLHPAHCVSCSALVGHEVTSLASHPSAVSIPCFRLLKYASYPAGSNSLAFPAEVSSSPSAATKPRRAPLYSLATHLTAEMLEIGQAHACHRFVVEDAESEKARLLLWLFNPAVRIAFCSSSSDVDLLGASPKSSPPVDASLPLQRTMNVVKIFFTVVEDEQALDVQDFINSTHSTPERISFPLEVVGRVTDLLRASKEIYPEGKRAFGEMESGFLERI